MYGGPKKLFRVLQISTHRLFIREGIMVLCWLKQEKVVLLKLKRETKRMPVSLKAVQARVRRHLFLVYMTERVSAIRKEEKKILPGKLRIKK